MCVARDNFRLTVKPPHHCGYGEHESRQSIDWFIRIANSANRKNPRFFFVFFEFNLQKLFRCDFRFIYLFFSFFPVLLLPFLLSPSLRLCGGSENTILIYRIGWRTHRTAVTHASQWLTRNWIESMVSCISIVRIVQANGSSIVDFRVIHTISSLLGSCMRRLLCFGKIQEERMWTWERERARACEGVCAVDATTIQWTVLCVRTVRFRWRRVIFEFRMKRRGSGQCNFRAAGNHYLCVDKGCLTVWSNRSFWCPYAHCTDANFRLIFGRPTAINNFVTMPWGC